MRVLILWADDASPNLGVRALGRGAAALVAAAWPDAEVVYQNYGHRAPQLPFGRMRSLVKERVLGTAGMQEWLSSFDVTLDTRSGDSFADIYGLDRLTVMSTVSEFATQAGVPVVLAPQTVGPFMTRRGRALARRSLRRARSVMVRDTQSARFLESVGRPADLVTTDVVFALPVPSMERTRDVVLNISGLLWQENPHVASSEYRASIAAIYHGLRRQGRQVALLAHVLDSANARDNDVTAVREFAASLDESVEVLIPGGLDDVRDIVASAHVVVGARMHACLNALSVGTPAIPMAYSRKFAPLLADLRWEHTVDLRTDVNPARRVLDALDADLAVSAQEVAARARVELPRITAALHEVVR